MDFDFAYDYEAVLARDPTIKRSEIEELKTWAQSLDSDSTVPKNITNKQLLVFHMACLQVMEHTKKCIKIHYNTKAKYPEQYDNRDGTTDIMKEVQEVQEFMYLPERTDEGHCILLHRLHDFDVERFNYTAGSKWSIMIYEALINEDGPSNGLILLFDMRGAKFGHITRVPIGQMARHMTYLQEGLNGRIHSIHVLNVTPLFDKILKLIRPFMKGELIKKMSLYQANMDWESFYKNVIPKRCLPSDFGGDLPDSQTINKQNIQRTLRNKEMFEAEEKQRHLFSKNNKKKYDIEANFDKLDID